MARFDLREYARRGAETRLSELNDEMDAITRAFPELRRGQTLRGKNGVRSGARGTAAGVQGATSSSGGRRRWKMSAAQKKAVSERMRRYWAHRRKAKTAQTK